LLVLTAYRAITTLRGLAPQRHSVTRDSNVITLTVMVGLVS